MNADLATDVVAEKGGTPPRSAGREAPFPPWLRRLVARAWFLPTVLTLAAGLFRIGRPELWRDELRSWSAAARPLGELFHLLGNTDAAVALYYLILHGWIRVFGDSALSMRLPSALAMAGATACVCLVGERLFDRRTAIFAGFVFAVVPNVSRFAQEVRPYAMTMLLAALSVLLLLRAAEKGTWLRWIGYALSVAGLGLMQIVALPFVAVHAVAIFLWWRRDRKVIVRWIIAVAGGLALVAPIALLSASQYGHQVGALPEATFGELTRLPPRLFASGLFAGAVIALAVLGWLRKWEAAAFVTAWAVVPIGAVWVISNLGDSYWMTRYLLFTLPGFALLAGAGLATIPFRAAVAALLVLTLLGAQDQRQLRWLGAHDVWQYPEVSNPFTWYSDAAQYVARHAQPGDAIAYADRRDYWLNDISLQYHLRGQELPRDIFVTQTAQERGDFWPIECEDPVACLGSDPPQRIWVYSMNFVPGAGPYLDMEPEKAEALEDRYWVVATYRPVGVGLGVSLLELRSDVEP